MCESLYLKVFPSSSALPSITSCNSHRSCSIATVTFPERSSAPQRAGKYISVSCCMHSTSHCASSFPVVSVGVCSFITTFTSAPHLRAFVFQKVTLPYEPLATLRLALSNTCFQSHTPCTISSVPVVDLEALILLCCFSLAFFNRASMFSPIPEWYKTEAEKSASLFSSMLLLASALAATALLAKPSSKINVIEIRTVASIADMKDSGFRRQRKIPAEEQTS
mmetsp:Transcript_30062/g.92362  ORF Transcript_30062/g.92362 Transcript_30062/m.92362 type:complete len:222 (-) Transcript_30062:8-673(-)